MPPLILTRPHAEAARWSAQLGGLGVSCIALPLIVIEPPPDRAALAAAQAALPGYAAVMFVSPAAAGSFALEEKRPAEQSHIGWPAIKTRAWVTGPGTRQALREAGVPDAAIDSPPADAPQFDSEALWLQVASQVRPGNRVLVVRGGGADGQPAGRDWLAQQLQAAGAQVHELVAYQRRAPVWGAAEQQVATRAATDGSWWLLSSSQAVDHLQALLPGQGWGAARAIATHPRIGTRARAAGFGRVQLLRPSPEDIAAFLQSGG